MSELRRRRDAYEQVCGLFGFLRSLHKMDDTAIKTSATKLVQFYSSDLSEELYSELLQFAEFIKDFPPEEIRV